MIILLAFISSLQTFANSQIKPGLWEIKTQMDTGKGQMNSMDKMKEALAKMPPEKRKKIEELMGQKGLGISSDGAMKICYTEESLKKLDTTMHHSSEKTKCQNKILDQSATKKVMEFTCENGSKGNVEWTFENNENYRSVMKITSAKGKNSEIKHQAHFISKDCGSVKPFGLTEMKETKK